MRLHALLLFAGLFPRLLAAQETTAAAQLLAQLKTEGCDHLDSTATFVNTDFNGVTLYEGTCLPDRGYAVRVWVVPLPDGSFVPLSSEPAYRYLHGRTTATWPKECRALPTRLPLPEGAPMSSDSLQYWINRLTKAVARAEPDFMTPVEPLPPEGLDAVQTLWRRDSVAVEWALARLTADGGWYGRFQNQMYGRYYLEFSGRAEPILYWLRRSEYPQWEWSLFAVRAPVPPSDETTFFWHECMALWPIVSLYSDSASGASLVDHAFPPWLSLAHSIARGVYRFLTPEHQAMIQSALPPYLIDAIGMH